MATRITISRIGQRNRSIVVDALNINHTTTTSITASGTSQQSDPAPSDNTKQYGLYIQTDEDVWCTGGVDPTATVGEGFFIAAGDRQTFCIDAGHRVAIIAA